MTTSTGKQSTGAAEDLYQQVRSLIDSLAYLPTAAGVAIKFVELGKNPDAEPADYAEVIQGDTSLSSKLLALSNSSWAGLRTKVTNVKMAVNLLGLGTVRTLAISYCMTGLHNELQLTPAESEVFWETSLSKAVAAKQYALRVEPRAADEAFVAGLFQDFALTLMYSLLRERYLAMLADPNVGVADQLAEERRLFGVDHAEVGRALAQRLGLPELFVDTIAFHHHYDRLSELVESRVVRDANFIAGLFPHALNAWNVDDANTCAEFLGAHASGADLATFVNDVQLEFTKVYAFFHDGRDPEAQLPELLAMTSREMADNTTQLVGRVNELIREAAATTVEVNLRVQELEDKASYDALTKVFNRQGLEANAGLLLARAVRYRTDVGVCYIDIDSFKAVNDTHGHEAGDAVLRMVVEVLRRNLPRQAVLARVGGDEFVMMLAEVPRKDAIELMERVVEEVAQQEIAAESGAVRVTLSVGFLHLKSMDQSRKLEVLLGAADKLMYEAKRAGGNQIAIRIV